MTLYKCSYCDYNTDNEYRWNKHISSKKHISKQNKCSNNFQDIDNILNGISSSNNNAVQDFFDIDVENQLDIETNIVDIETNIVDIETNIVDIGKNIETKKDNIHSNINKDSNLIEMDDSNISSDNNVQNDINNDNEKNKENYDNKINLLYMDLECYKRKYNIVMEELNKFKKNISEPEPNNKNYTDFTFNTNENISPVFINDSDIHDNEIDRIRHSINKLKEIGKYKFFKLDDINLISNNLNKEIETNIESELNIIEIDAQTSYDLFDPFLSVNYSDNDN